MNIDEEKLKEFNEKYRHTPNRYVSKEALEDIIAWCQPSADELVKLLEKELKE